MVTAIFYSSHGVICCPFNRKLYQCLNGNNFLKDLQKQVQLIFCSNFFHNQIFFFIYSLIISKDQTFLESEEEFGSDLVPFPVSGQPNEQQLLIKWQQICINNNFELPEIVLTHTYYPFNNMKQFQSNYFLRNCLTKID